MMDRQGRARALTLAICSAMSSCRLSRRSTPMLLRESVAEVAQLGVVDPEMVGDLVHDRDPHLVSHLLPGTRDLQDGQPVNGNPVGQHARVPLPPGGERYPLVQTEQAGLRRIGLVLDE